MRVKAPFQIEAIEISEGVKLIGIRAWAGTALVDIDHFIVPLQEEKDERVQELQEVQGHLSSAL